MRKTILALTVLAAALAAPAVQAQNKPIKNVGITLGSIILVLGVAVGASLLKERREGRSDTPAT